MQAVIRSPRNAALCAPLTTGRHIGDCLVANIPLKDLIGTELRRAGFEIAEHKDASGRTVHLPLDHWIDVGALCMLARQDPGTCLYDSDGDLVAWKGCDEPDQCTKKIITEAPCFRISYPWEFIQLNEDVLEAINESNIEGDVSPLASVEGTLILGKGSKVLPGVVIEGTVVIGDNCKIGPNAYIRGNTSIGDNCVVGNAVEIKNSVIYHHTSIAHLSYVGDSIIGSHVYLGAGTVLSNRRHDGRHHRCSVNGELINTGREKLGAIIGDGVCTGVNTSVFPARKIGRGRTTRPGAIVERDMM
ncbi:bifunctional protein GlmU [Rubritalea halochordaticola]|uniref:Bifunctional protein GlmU n=1 Tax=Rubritalea halochordaticola TaxID=714537 RepID=A0ABP9V1Z1_9BACT